jgi:hypothetical protein
MLFAPALSAQPGEVAIQFGSPEKFTDFRIYGLDVQWLASFFAGQISDDLKPTLNENFPGSKLTFLLQDSSGRTLATDSTRITDTSSHNALVRHRSGSELLYYQKQMLKRWLKSVRPSSLSSTLIREGVYR